MTFSRYEHHPITNAFRTQLETPFSTVQPGVKITSISPRVFHAIDQSIEQNNVNQFPLEDLAIIWQHMSERDHLLIEWMDILFHVYEHLYGKKPYHLNDLFKNQRLSTKSNYFPRIQHDAYFLSQPNLFKTRYPMPITQIDNDEKHTLEQQLIYDCLHQPSRIAQTIERLHNRYQFNHMNYVVQSLYSLVKQYHPHFMWTNDTILEIKDSRTALIRHDAEWLSDTEKKVAFAKWAPMTNQKNWFRCHSTWLIEENWDVFFDTTIKKGFDFSSKTMFSLINCSRVIPVNHPSYLKHYHNVWHQLLNNFSSKSLVQEYVLLENHKAVDIFNVFEQHQPSFFPLKDGILILLNKNSRQAQFTADILNFYGKKQRVTSKNTIQIQFARFLEEAHDLVPNTLLQSIDMLKSLGSTSEEIVQQILQPLKDNVIEETIYL